jgi:hypothetical protein
MIHVKMGDQDSINVLIGFWINGRFASTEKPCSVAKEWIGQHTYTVHFNEHGGMTDVCQGD